MTQIPFTDRSSQLELQHRVARRDLAKGGSRAVTPKKSSD